MRALTTERLILRRWRRRDLNDLYEYAKSAVVGPRAGWEPHRNKRESRQILKLFIQTDDLWAIVLKKTGKVIGSVGLHPDAKRPVMKAKMLGYVLNEDYWGQGFMTEAARRVVQYAFEDLRLDVLSAYHYPFNTGSKNVIEKCGFTYEGILRRASKIYDGQMYDDVCYSILREEYGARR